MLGQHRCKLFICPAHFLLPDSIYVFLFHRIAHGSLHRIFSFFRLALAFDRCDGIFETACHRNIICKIKLSHFWCIHIHFSFGWKNAARFFPFWFLISHSNSNFTKYSRFDCVIPYFWLIFFLVICLANVNSNKNYYRHKIRNCTALFPSQSHCLSNCVACDNLRIYSFGDVLQMRAFAGLKLIGKNSWLVSSQSSFFNERRYSNLNVFYDIKQLCGRYVADIPCTLWVKFLSSQISFTKNLTMACE